MAHEVDEVMRELKLVPGYVSFAIMNNDGIVIKYENMSYPESIHLAAQVLSLSAKASKYTRELIEPPDNDVESIRLKTVEYEMIIAQVGNFTLVLTQGIRDEEVVVYGLILFYSIYIGRSSFYCSIFVPFRPSSVF